MGPAPLLLRYRFECLRHGLKVHVRVRSDYRAQRKRFTYDMRFFFNKTNFVWSAKSPSIFFPTWPAVMVFIMKSSEVFTYGAMIGKTKTEKNQKPTSVSEESNFRNRRGRRHADCPANHGCQQDQPLLDLVDEPKKVLGDRMVATEPECNKHPPRLPRRPVSLTDS